MQKPKQNQIVWMGKDKRFGSDDETLVFTAAIGRRRPPPARRRKQVAEDLGRSTSSLKMKAKKKQKQKTKPGNNPPQPAATP